MKNIEQHAYTDFLKHVKKYGETELPDPQNIINHFNPHFNSNNLYPDALYYLIDYVHHTYLFFLSNGSSFAGYDTQTLLDGGPALLYTMRHPADFSIYDEKIFPINLTYIKDHAGEPLADCTFTTNYRVKSKDGQWLSVSQRSCYISTAADGTPLAAIDSVTDITHFKSDTRIINVIEQAHNGEKPSVAAVNYFIPDDALAPISKREANVLKWACEGLSSKQIADKMHISIHTINNHRKNMLGKTNCKNLSELVSHAMKTGMLLNTNL